MVCDTLVGYLMGHLPKSSVLESVMCGLGILGGGMAMEGSDGPLSPVLLSVTSN